MPRTVVLEDDSYFVLAAYFNGIAHPPGYPLYTFIAHLFTFLPITNVALKVHLCSAFFAVITCCGLWWFSEALTKNKKIAYLASLGLGVSITFWSQSIIAEVYTLNTFFIIWLLCFRIYIEKSIFSNSKIFILGLIYGLSLANHWPLIVLSTLGLFFLYYPYRFQLLKNIHFVIAGVLIGVTPYLFMVFNSQSLPFISFYGPIQSFADFVFFVSRQAYAETDHSLTAGIKDKLQFLLFFLYQIYLQFGFIGALLGVIGFLRQWKLFPRHLCFGLLFIFLGNTALLSLLLGFDFDVWRQNVVKVYPLIGYIVFAFWFAIGFDAVITYLSKHQNNWIKNSYIHYLFAIILLFSIFISGITVNYRANDNWSDEYADAILKQLDKNSVVFTHGDFDMGALVYAQQIRGKRDDVILYNGKGVLLENRLFYPFITNNKQRKNIINEFIINTERTVYYTLGLPNNFKETDYVLFHEVKDNESMMSNEVNITPDSLEYLSKLISDGIPVDPWQSMHYKLIINDFCRAFLKIRGDNDSNVKSRIENIIPKVCHLYHGKLLQVEYMMLRDDIDWLFVEKLINEAKFLQNQAVQKSDYAWLPYIKGEINYKKENIETAIKYYKKSMRIWPSTDNKAKKRLELLNVEYEDY